MIIINVKHFRSEFLRSFRIDVFVALGLFLIAAQSGCRTASLPPPATTGRAGSLWDHSEILEHLRVLNSSEVSGRAAGTGASALAADYLAYRMAQYELQPVLQSGFRVTYVMPVHAETYGQSFADIVGVMGYIGGKHPVLSRELVIVCADLNALGASGAVPSGGVGGMGAGASALLEVARVQSASAEAFSTPERTILFAAWPEEGLVGFRAYLSRPVWPLDATRAVIYIGLRQPDAIRLRELPAMHEIDLYAISPPDSSIRRQVGADAAAQNPAGSVPVRSQSVDGDDLSGAMEQASLAAERMAREANDLLVSLAAAPVPLPSAPTVPPSPRARVDAH